MQLKNTPIEQINYDNKIFFIKRDDLLHEEFTGNKARKFLYYLDNEFNHIKKLISYGSAQANSLYSFSALAKLKGWKFDFYVNHIPQHIKNNPRGNYRGALKNGANIIEKSTFKEEQFQALDGELFIPEGGRSKQSEYGISLLAKEIKEYIDQNNWKYDDINIILPSGTGTTALFIQKNLPLNLKVLTLPCVGDSNYLKKQFYLLEEDEKYHPTILKPSKKYHFGKLYQEFFTIWKDILKKTNIEFDLLYDPQGLKQTLKYMDENQNKKIIYIHQGGLKGNETMLERYKRKYEK